jgi:hypothetical protein
MIEAALAASLLLAQQLVADAPKSRPFALTGCLVDEGERVTGNGARPAQCRRDLALEALGGEHVAFQIVLQAPLPEVPSVRVRAPVGAPPLKLWVEQFVNVTTRSNTNGTFDSLAFTASARPPDDENLGWLPDALLPSGGGLPFRGDYAAQRKAGRAAVLYAEAFVPLGSKAATYGYVVELSGGLAVSEHGVSLDVVPVDLPYRALRAFAFYEPGTLERRFNDPRPVELSLIQTLHAHGLDSVTHIVDPSDVERLRGSFDGSFFTAAAGYEGPGVGVPTSVAPLGQYGMLGDAAPEKVPNVRALLAALPPVEDVFLYAVDEQCKSPRGPDWRALLRDEKVSLRVGHTCHEPPQHQPVDLVMMPAQAFDPDNAAEARALGKKVWIYNGQLPFSGAPALDVPLTSLTANGWIASLFDVDRWFYWETIFWNDGNRGGKGPRDVFTSAETFHNADGDTSLYDGLLLYPGRMPEGTDLQRDEVYPSLRLKALRRGLEDGALLSLAAEVDARATYAIARRIVGHVLDEVKASDPSDIDLRPAAFAAARAELRALIAGSKEPPRADAASVAAGLEQLRALRRYERSRTGVGVPPSEIARTVVAFFLPLGLLLFGWAAVAILYERRLSLRGSARSQS